MMDASLWNIGIKVKDLDLGLVESPFTARLTVSSLR